MILLLDTHIFLWFLANDKRLTEAMRAILRDPDNTIFVSVVSVWEITVKHHLGKLPLPEAPETYLLRGREKHLMKSLSLEEADTHQLSNLPDIHRDPFDKMLICQALRHGMTIVTVDEAILAYPVPTLDAR